MSGHAAGSIRWSLIEQIPVYWPATVMSTVRVTVNVPDADTLKGNPGTVVADIIVGLVWQTMPDTRTVGLPALSNNEMRRVKF